jgi:hypothetical protein
MDGEAEDDLTDLHLVVATARERHAGLSAEVETLQAHARLKKQKLVLKDQIAQLENLLMPDIIA